MDKQDLLLYEFLWDKTLSFGCIMQMDGYTATNIETCQCTYPDIVESDTPSWNWEIIGHEPTLSDFHKWMNENCKVVWQQESNLSLTGRYGWERDGITYYLQEYPSMDNSHLVYIPYDSSKSLLNQSEETKAAIIELIKLHGNKG